MRKQVVINMDVIINELEEWDLNDNIKKDSVRIIYDEPTSEDDSGIQPK